MNKQQLPVDMAEEKSAQQLQESLSKKAGVETISDDASIPEQKAKRIADVERIVRETLAIFGMDYDALIRMDGKSLYARVVSRRPDVLQAVMQDDNPVLAALKIAIGFQPYADFIEQYGEEPEAIKKAIREEIMAEMKSARSAKEQQVSVDKSSPSFNSYQPKKKMAKKDKTSTASSNLDEIFKK